MIIKRIRHCVVASIFIFSIFAAASGQGLSVCTDIEIVVTPPFSPYLSDWQSHPNQLILSLTLRYSDVNVAVYLGGEISNDDGSVYIRTANPYRPNTPIWLAPDNTHQVDQNDIIEMFNVDNLWFEGVDAGDIERTGRLPEGNYNICVYAYDYNTNASLCDRDDPAVGCECECSIPFAIVYLEPPIILSPDCGAEIDLALPLFNWIAPAGAPVNLMYNLELVEDFSEPPNPNEAFSNQPNLFFEHEVGITQYAYLPSDPPLLSGHTYAWRVTARDPNEAVFFRNDGHSEVCSFSCAESLANYQPPNLISPINNFYLPMSGEPSIRFEWSLPDGVPPETRYTLRIVEVNPIDRDPQQAIEQANPIFEQTLDSDHFDFLLSEHPLVQLHRYAWRVTALVPESDIAFVNDGHSDIRVFNYGASIEVPRLDVPPYGNTRARPIRLAWLGTPLPDGAAPQFHLKAVEIPAGDEPPDLLPENEGELLLSRNLSATSFEIDREIPGFSPDHRYAWQVREYDSRPETRFVFENDGNSDVWVFIVGTAADEGGGDFQLGMEYPGQGDRIADIAPPFISTVAGNSGDRHMAITIQEITEFEGSPIGEPIRFTGGLLIPDELRGILFLNRYGAGGDNPVPVIADNWESTPGSYYRWTLEVWPGQDENDMLRNWAEFAVAPMPRLVFPINGQEANGYFAHHEGGFPDDQQGERAPADNFDHSDPFPNDGSSFNYEYHLPTLNNTDLFGSFVPGAPHPFKVGVWGRIPDPEMIRDTVFQKEFSNYFETGHFDYYSATGIPEMENREYEWIVETRIDNRVTASDSARFMYTGTADCGSECVCPIAIYPPLNAENIPAVPHASFCIGFRPRINEGALFLGNIPIWIVHDDELPDQTMERDPDFFAEFDMMIPRGEGPGISQFDIQLVNAVDDSLDLLPNTEYLWRIDVEYDRNNIREDGTVCLESSSRGGPFRFRTQGPHEIVECNPMTDDLTPQTNSAQIGDNLQIGGYRLTLNRPFCDFDNQGRITGKGFVRNTEYGDWAVEFANLVVNRNDEVIEGKVKAQQRDDIPQNILQSIQQVGGMTAYQVNRLNELWHYGGNLLEAIVGDKKVPFGQNLDLADIENREESGWSFKATFTQMTFEPNRAYYDLAVGVRIPLDTNDGEPSQWLGLYCQDIPFCIGEDVQWLAAIRLLEDFSTGSPNFDLWDLVFKQSPRRDMPRDYTMQPGDGTAIIISDRGFEQLHLEMQIGIPRTVMVPQRLSSGDWVDMADGQTVFTGTFDVMRSGREMPDRGNLPAAPLGGGFYVIGDLPMSRIVDFPMRIESRDIVWDASTSWSPTPSGNTEYSIAGIPTVSGMPNLGSAWDGLFVREAEVLIDGVGSVFGMKNFAWGSPLSFEAFAAPGVDIELGDAMTVRLDTIDFAVDRGNIRRARIVTNTIFPGAKSGEIGIDLVYQRIPDDAVHDPASAILISIRAREEQKYPITDYLAFTINRGSQMTASYVDPPPQGQNKWGFQFDIGGGLEMFSASGRDTTISIGGIEFEHLRFASDGRGLQAPTITFLGIPISDDDHDGGGGGGGGGHGDNAAKKVAGFPISIDNLSLSFANGGSSLGLAADLNIALTGQDGGLEFGGGAGLELNGLLEMQDGRLQWDAPTLSLTSINIDFESPSLTIHGAIEFYNNDPTWGDGFGGEASVQMAKMFNAGAELRFGCNDNYRYWFVKGDVTLNEAMAIPIGPVGIYGFIGGAYQHMTPVVSREGETVVGINYEPTAENTFGLMAGVHLGVMGSPSSFHAKVLLEARFLDANLTDINLNGRGWFMCDLLQECNDADDSWAEIDMNMDFQNDRFHAVIEANINLLPLLSINAPEGSVDILFEPGNWHVYIGRGPFSDPDRNTVTARLLPDVFNIRAEGYCMAGNNIAVNVGGIELVGGGFATGIKIEFHIEGRFLVFYGEVDGLFQSELAVIHLEEESRGCLSGADGWYALADVRIFLGLEVGIDADLWLVRGRFEIFDAEMGLDVLMGGPNPTFMDGDARGEFSILDGLLHGSFHYHFHLGDEVPGECLAAATDRFVMPEPIVSISPMEGERNISVFTSIGLGFAMKEGVIGALARDDEDSLRVRFRLVQPLDVRPRNGALVPGTLRFSADKLSAEWTTEETLEESTRYTITAIAIGEVFRDGAWREARRQTKTSHFRTGTRPRFIADRRLIDFQYPLDRQRYSYVLGHENRHYIHLARNMNYLFNDLAPDQTLIAEYTNEYLSKHEKPITFEPYAGGCGGFVCIDNPEVHSDRRYHLRLIKRTDTLHGREINLDFLGDLNRINYEQISASYISRARDISIRAGGTLQEFATAGGTSLVSRLQGNAQSRVIRNGANIDTVLYEWYFRTGEYNTPDNKFVATTLSFDSRFLGENSSFVQFTVSSPEPYDDDLTALVFLRAPSSTRDSDARDWLNFLKMNDDLARDYETLIDLIGEDDAVFVREFVITTESRLQAIPGYIYFDATAPWQFNKTNLNRYRLANHEIRFEEIQPDRDPFEIDGPDIGPPGGIGGFWGIDIPEPPDSYSESVVTLPFNALDDLASTTWRYRNCLDRVWDEDYIAGHRIVTTVADLLTAEAEEAILEIGNRAWRNIPDGTYKLALTQKTINWQLQSTIIRRWLSPHVYRNVEADILEEISMFGDATHISFGEFSCGDPVNVPFRMKSLEVR